MRILTQNLKNGKTDILNVPSPSINSNKIRVRNEYSLISTGTESLIVNFGKASWLNKARQQPDRVKDVINKIKSSGLFNTVKAIRNKLYSPMPMGYAAVGVVYKSQNEHNFKEGSRVFTNSFHQEEALVDYNMCVEIPKDLDSKSASFGAIGGIAMQSINCIPQESKYIAVIGLGLLGQVTLRILRSLGYQCIVYDLDAQKVELAEKYGVKGIKTKNITKEVLSFTKGKGVDSTIIAAASLSSDIVNQAAEYTKRKGRIISSGLVGLNLIRDKFFKKQVELVISNSSGNKNHRSEGSSYKNIKDFFDLIVSNKVYVLDLISEEIGFENAKEIYSFPKDSLFFSKLIKYKNNNLETIHTFYNNEEKTSKSKLKVGLIGAGNFAISTLIPNINKTKEGHTFALYGREGLSLFSAMKKFNLSQITTDYIDFYDNIDTVCITTSHQSHYSLLKKSINLSKSTWIEKPLVISIEQLLDIHKSMLSKKLVYFVGYNRSYAPWTDFIRKKINSNKTEISMTINAGILDPEHWLLDDKKCGGRILGELCHFVDLAITLLKHTKLKDVKCIARDRYYQDTGNYILNFEDGSNVNIDYRSDLAPSVPKEKITVDVLEKKFVNNNWQNFNNGTLFNLPTIKNGKGHFESISLFLKRVKEKKNTSKSEISDISFSTYISIKLQAMNEGDILNLSEKFQDEILSKI